MKPAIASDVFAQRGCLCIHSGAGAVTLVAGLPATVTSLLSLTCAKLVKEQVYVKENEMVEALGSTSVICSDKTGTLTKNLMR